MNCASIDGVNTALAQSSDDAVTGVDKCNLRVARLPENLPAPHFSPDRFASDETVFMIADTVRTFRIVSGRRRTVRFNIVIVNWALWLVITKVSSEAIALNLSLVQFVRIGFKAQTF